jgi:hypothetical protein
MISITTVFLLVAAIYAGLTWHLASKPAYFLGVAVTLAFWSAAAFGPSSLANVIWFLMGLIGSIVFGLVGILSWWRVRTADRSVQRPWLVASALCIAPVILYCAVSLFRGRP